MLIVSGTSRAENRRDLAQQCGAPRVPIRLVIQRSRLGLGSQTWRDYWQPCRPFFEVDLRLVQRLNRLKKAWRLLLQHPSDRTEANQFVVTTPEQAACIRGERLW
jgi:hypothetical protein